MSDAPYGIPEVVSSLLLLMFTLDWLINSICHLQSVVAGPPGEFIQIIICATHHLTLISRYSSLSILDYNSKARQVGSQLIYVLGVTYIMFLFFLSTAKIGPQGPPGNFGCH